MLAYLEKPNAFLTVLRSERPASKSLAAPAEEGAADGEEAPGERPGPGGAEELGNEQILYGYGCSPDLPWGAF